VNEKETGAIALKKQPYTSAGHGERVDRGKKNPTGQDAERGEKAQGAQRGNRRESQSRCKKRALVGGGDERYPPAEQNRLWSSWKKEIARGMGGKKTKRRKRADG